MLIFRLWVGFHLSYPAKLNEPGNENLEPNMIPGSRKCTSEY